MGKPIVAIVGRPNVGKSTLFNKLAGKRIAIVDDMPGVTRDRIYAQAEWLNNKFTIIDTGGIEPESEDVIVAQMRRQAQMAIEMADVVLFIVDGKQGLADADREVAQMLRKANKSIVLAVNKIDRRQLDDNIYEFYNLGLGDPMAISASQGLGLGDLLDEVVDKFPETNEDDEENEYIRIAMVGRPNVGKSSLINRILGEEKHIVSNIPGTTRDSVDSYIEREEGKFALIDTAGLRRKSKIKEQVERYSAVRTIASIENADVCILMLDAEQGIAEQDEKIIGYAHELNKAIIVIVNKWDLIEKDDKTMKNFKDKLRYELSFLPYASFLFISAKTGQRVNKVLGMAKECYNNYCKRVKTGILNEVISKAILMKEPPVVGTSRLKVYYVTQIGTKPPTFVFFVNNPELVHFSYRRYLENQLRENFDFSGTGIKLEFRERKE
ncbi:ribosome biogenesis GTPase Der [Clostridium botulinum C]|uniref:GTPase Der n=5 Tax=Clostridium TaxID=1485 RepID=A0A9Q4TN50_CLOBO|nr:MULTISPECIES: ribosome biogenesis GTPase Der [Clostridium]AYF54744.1 ribosome biogenesis GTPase Der [Clostridium novyi]EES91750.1 ribosome-associated GTPase EngA [Clostridium botulinum D str. 1873]KEI10332.1 GTP-binding protein Der [Clostridium sp. K25]KEI13579.1 GTP-binding protein Der [Clostridium novyi B str. NCTC 9691]KEI17100.1 GTP-binding protein Der [Clostridium haemolyticum NCTC 9693]